MSSSLHWRLESKGHYLGYELKFAFRHHYNSGCSLEGELHLTRESIPFLEGIVASNGQGKKDAEKLIKLIEKHGTIIVWEEY